MKVINILVALVGLMNVVECSQDIKSYILSLRNQSIAEIAQYVDSDTFEIIRNSESVNFGEMKFYNIRLTENQKKSLDGKFIIS